jgi:hypothetical protein
MRGSCMCVAHGRRHGAGLPLHIDLAPGPTACWELREWLGVEGLGPVRKHSGSCASTANFQQH